MEKVNSNYCRFLKLFQVNANPKKRKHTKRQKYRENANQRIKKWCQQHLWRGAIKKKNKKRLVVIFVPKNLTFHIFPTLSSGMHESINKPVASLCRCARFLFKHQSSVHVCINHPRRENTGHQGEAPATKMSHLSIMPPTRLCRGRGGGDVKRFHPLNEEGFHLGVKSA